MIINHNINNLSGGVSRQPDEARFDNQVQEMINFIPTVSNGLSRRNQLEKVADNIGVLPDDMPMHSYDRGDGLEKYGMFIQGNSLKIFDLDGNAKTVNTYTETGNPIDDWYTEFGDLKSKDIDFLTIGDTTWLLNKNKVVKTTNSVSTENSGYSVFFWAKRSFDNGQGGGYTYEVIVDGNKYSVNKTNSADVISCHVENDATKQGLAQLITGEDAEPNSSGVITGNGYTVTVKSSVMKISKSESFTYSYGDSWGNQASVGWKDSVSEVSDLPAKMSGFSESDVGIISITGNDKNKFTEYYLKWTGEFWTETLKGGIKDEIDYATMPCKLVRNADGTFTLGYNKKASVDNFDDDWEKRTKGDDDSNPLPSFIDNKISTMFFFKNRLGFTCEENVVLSEAGSYYNFFATTAIDVLDSDPIDAGVDSDTVSILRNVNAVSGSLTLWADNSQFVLGGGDVLSPATTRISKTSSYFCDNSLKPLLLDNEIMFFRRVGDRLDAFSYSPSSVNTDKSTAEELTSHIKGYLPNTINNAVVNGTNNMVFFTDSIDKNIIYCYRYHIHNSTRIMTSWFKFIFEKSITSIECIDNKLFVAYDNSTICKLELDEKFENGICLDYNIDTGLNDLSFESSVVLSKFNVETKQDTRVIREPFYAKNLKVNKSGDIDLVFRNDERSTNKKVLSKQLNRKIFVGGNSEKVYIEFNSSYNNGCVLNAISLEGLVKIRSRNA